MAKVKVCLDDLCTKYYMLDDGRTVMAAKDKCELKNIKTRQTKKGMDKWKQKFERMAKGTKKYLTINSDPGWKEGDESVL